ncbi:hypothetical protein [Neobacillus cucumis]|uniref:hypothetical protein n=1 Tax=Neobacillus cucumis TaxID=1740721 RepID=UPI0019648423|nr:hypothetical protein [Neobacillus cucumis]MBM7654812.1 YqxM protein [Neobacillus cucumis]
MRYTRVRKFSKNRNYINQLSVIQLLVFIYIITLLTSYLSSNTNAFYNDIDNITGKIQVNTWIKQE